MNHNSPEFKKLQQKWYEKIKKTGFDDIEYTTTEMLKTTTASKLQKINAAGYRQSKQQYYTYAGQFLYECSFSNKKDRLIWDLHSQGLGVRQIEKIFLRRNIKGYKKTKISEIVLKYKKQLLEKLKRELDEQI